MARAALPLTILFWVAVAAAPLYLDGWNLGLMAQLKNIQ